MIQTRYIRGETGTGTMRHYAWLTALLLLRTCANASAPPPQMYVCEVPELS
jgi:hypothetical protein